MEIRFGELDIGTIFADRYRILERLGKGGMGVVYGALDIEIQEYVAIKLLVPEIASNTKMIERFRNELKLARKITHKNVCRMYHLGREEETFFITMEYVKGENLKCFIDKAGRLPEKKILTIAKQLCSGLAEAHSLGVVHRDLKPQNIMIDKDGNAKIMDFGIARSIEGKRMTASGMAIGTPDYMSPEQIEGDEADERSDIYLLGVILYEIVTGQKPFDGKTPYSVALKHKTDPPPDPRKLNSELSKDLSRLIQKCMEKDRKNRYQGAEELLSELDRIEERITPLEKTGLGRRRDKAIPKRFFRPQVILGVLLIITALVVSGYFYFKPRQQPEKTITIEKKTPEIPGQKEQNAEVLAPLLGAIKIDSVPSEAKVYISGKFEGLTPLTHELAPGAYQMRIGKDPEYKEITDVLNIRLGETVSRNYDLVPVYLLKIDTVPQGTNIMIDGNYRGKTPLQVELGKNTCRINIEQSREWTKISETLTLKPGLNHFQRSLQKIMFTLSIKTNPPGAEVFIDEKLVGVSPVSSLSPLGEQKIEIKKAGYKDIEDAITIDSNFEKNYFLTIVESKKGKILIKVRPYADVLIDGTLIGEVPPVRTVEINEGHHIIEFVSVRMDKKYKVEIQIKAGDHKEIQMNMETGQSQFVDIK